MDKSFRASALMQGLADGYFVLPYTIGDYFSDIKMGPISQQTYKKQRKGVKIRLKFHEQ
jgi:succinate dehydrogenase / fumarate reductase flavoprotein subunit